MANGTVYERSYYPYYPADLPVLIVRWMVNVIEFLLALRFLFVLFGADPASSFVAWLYQVTGHLISPFAGAFPDLVLGGFVVDVSTVLAMIGYAVVGWLILQVFAFISAALSRTL
jgi:hypothetical protein